MLRQISFGCLLVSAILLCLNTVCLYYGKILLSVVVTVPAIVCCLVPAIRRSEWKLKNFKESIFITIAVCFIYAGWIVLEFRKQLYLTLCSSNQIRIEYALRQYAAENEGWFPNKNGAEAFQTLLDKPDRMIDYDTLICPNQRKNVQPGNETQPLGEDNVSYVYRSGLRDTPENAKKPLIWDKTGNHHFSGFVIFVGGKIRIYRYKEWEDFQKKWNKQR